MVCDPRFRGRRFQLWGYTVSHGFAFFRSPNIDGHEFCLDVIFVGVEFLSVPRHLFIEGVRPATAEELSLLRSRMAEPERAERAWVIHAEGAPDYHVVAAAMHIDASRGSTMDPPWGAEGRWTR